MSCSCLTASHSSDSTNGRASPDGIGVTRPTHQLAIVGVSNGSTTINRRRRPATSAYTCIASPYSSTSGPPMSQVRTRHVRGRRLGQVVQHVVDGDRLNLVAHPLRRRHHRQPVGQMADHLERRRPRADDDPRLQDHGLDARLEQDLADGCPRPQMSGQVGTARVQSG